MFNPCAPAVHTVAPIAHHPVSHAVHRTVGHAVRHVHRRFAPAVRPHLTPPAACGQVAGPLPAGPGAGRVRLHGLRGLGGAASKLGVGAAKLGAAAVVAGGLMSGFLSTSGDYADTAPSVFSSGSAGGFSDDGFGGVGGGFVAAASLGVPLQISNLGRPKATMTLPALATQFVPIGSLTLIDDTTPVIADLAPPGEDAPGTSPGPWPTVPVSPLVASRTGGPGNQAPGNQAPGNQALNTRSPTDTAAVPEPASVFASGAGLMAMGLFRRFRS